MEAMLDVTEADLSRESLSDYAYETFMKKEPLINSLRETRPDMWLSYVAYLFDLNFPASFVWILESGYMEKILRRYAPIDPEDKKRWRRSFPADSAKRWRSKWCFQMRSIWPRAGWQRSMSAKA